MEEDEEYCEKCGYELDDCDCDPTEDDLYEDDYADYLNEEEEEEESW